MRWRLGLGSVVLLIVVSGCAGAERGPVDPPADPHTFCEVALPASWQAALASGPIAHEPGESMTVLAVSADGRSLFVDSTGDGAREVAWLHDGQRTTLLRLPDPAQPIDWAMFDGRWLVIRLGPADGGSTAPDSGVYAWDSTTMFAAQLVKSITTSVESPVVSGGRIFYDIIGVDTPGVLEMVDLATGHGSPIASDVVFGPFRYGSLVLWEATHPTPYAGGSAHLAAALITTGQPTDLPAELAGPITRNSWFVGDADTLVATTGDDFSANPAPPRNPMYAWQPGTPRVTITNMAIDSWEPGSMQVAGDFVGWTTGGARYLADLRSGSYARISSTPGDFQLSAGALVLTSGTAPALLESSLIRPAELPPLPTCATNHSGQST